MELNTILITQARMGSTRLPGKVLVQIGQQPILKIHLSRIKKSAKVDKIIVATTLDQNDDAIAELSRQWGFGVYRGSEEDVLDRFYQAVRSYKPEWVVRVTSDCPLNDGLLIDEAITIVQNSNFDYCITSDHFPDGMDVEVFRFEELEFAWHHATLKSDREHVTPFIRRKAQENQKYIAYENIVDLSHIRMTVDEQSDLDAIVRLISLFGTNQQWLTYADYINAHPNEFPNQKIIRNEGYLKSLKNDG